MTLIPMRACTPDLAHTLVTYREYRHAVAYMRQVQHVDRLIVEEGWRDQTLTLGQLTFSLVRRADGQSYGEWLAANRLPPAVRARRK